MIYLTSANIYFKHINEPINKRNGGELNKRARKYEKIAKNVGCDFNWIFRDFKDRKGEIASPELDDESIVSLDGDLKDIVLCLLNFAKEQDLVLSGSMTLLYHTLSYGEPTEDSRHIIVYFAEDSAKVVSLDVTSIESDYKKLPKFKRNRITKIQLDVICRFCEKILTDSDDRKECGECRSVFCDKCINFICLSFPICCWCDFERNGLGQCKHELFMEEKRRLGYTKNIESVIKNNESDDD